MLEIDQYWGETEIFQEARHQFVFMRIYVVQMRFEVKYQSFGGGIA